MRVSLRFKVFSAFALGSVAVMALVVACGSNGSGGTCTGSSCDGGSNETSTQDGWQPQPDGAQPQLDGSVDGGTDADADSSVTEYCDGAAGTLDETFGDGGMVVLPLTAADGRAVVVQPDGKVVVVGSGQSDAGTALTLVRLLPDGSLDPTFGSGGVAQRFVGGSSFLRAVALQADGKIVAAGGGRPVNQDFAVVRYLGNGSPDLGFGDGGLVLTDFGSLDHANSLVILSDGRIIAAGFTAAGNNDFAVARYNSDGSLDTTFGGTGTVTIDLRGTSDDARGVLLLSSSRVLTAGVTDDGTGRLDVGAAWLTSTGSVDMSVGDAGKFISAFGGAGSDTASGAALDSAGRPVFAGLRDGSDFGVIRLTAAGVLDPTFGTGGVVRTDFSGRNDTGDAIEIQEDGKLVVVGTSLSGVSTDGRIAVARYLPDGGLDPTFGIAGQSLTPLPSGYSGAGLAQGAALGTCNLVVVGLWTDPGPENRIGVARFHR